MPAECSPPAMHSLHASKAAPWWPTSAAVSYNVRDQPALLLNPATLPDTISVSKFAVRLAVAVKSPLV